MGAQARVGSSFRVHREIAHGRGVGSSIRRPTPPLVLEEDALGPKMLDEIVGQPGALKKIRNRVDAWGQGARLERAMCFVGPPGTGKTSSALLLEYEIRCRVPEWWSRYEWNTEKFDCGQESLKTLTSQLEGIGSRYDWNDPNWRAKKVVVIDEFERFKDEDRVKLRGTIEKVMCRALVVITENKELEDEGLVSRSSQVRFYHINDEASRRLVERTSRAQGRILSPAAVAWVAKNGKGDARRLKDLIWDVDPDLVEPSISESAARPLSMGAHGPAGGRPTVTLDDVEAAARLHGTGLSYAQIARAATAHDTNGKKVKVTDSLVRREISRWRREHPVSDSTTPSRTMPNGVDSGDSRGDADPKS
jgi:hypothetical protein